MRNELTIPLLQVAAGHLVCLFVLHSMSVLGHVKYVVCCCVVLRYTA